MGPWKISLPTRAQLVAREIFALQNIEAGMLSYFVLYQWFSLFIFLYVPRYTTKRQLQPLSFRRQNISQLEYIQCWLYLTLELVKGEPLQWEWFDHIVITIDSFCICLSPTVKYNETEWFHSMSQGKDALGHSLRLRRNRKFLHCVFAFQRSHNAFTFSLKG